MGGLRLRSSLRYGVGASIVSISDDVYVIYYIAVSATTYRGPEMLNRRHHNRSARRRYSVVARLARLVNTTAESFIGSGWRTLE
jgi:hypothetical protein